MQRALVLAAGLVLAGGPAWALAGCAPAGGTRPGAAERDVLRLVSPTDFPGWNTLVLDNAEVSLFSELIHGYLLRADQDGRLVPDLAVAVPTVANGGLSPDGRTVTYRLRRGLRWHDGAPFDARDVVFSFGAAMNPDNAVPDRTGFDHVAAVRALDPYTVRVRLRRPFAPFVASAFTLAANDPYPILPAHLLAGKHDLNRDPYNAAPVGLGPYALASWERGSRVVLRADPRYFRGRPPIGRIEIAIVPDPNTRLALWRTGKLDVVIGRVQDGRSYLDALRSVAGARVQLKPHYEFDYLQMNLAHPPLDDRRVRRAVVQAIDRGRIMRALDGELWVPGQSDRLPGQFAYDPALVQPAYDPAAAARALEARRLAAAAGRQPAQGWPGLGAGLRGHRRVGHHQPLRHPGPAGPEQGRRAQRGQGLRLQPDLGHGRRARHPQERALRPDLYRLAAQRRQRPLVPVPLRHPPAGRRQPGAHLRPAGRARGAGRAGERRPGPRGGRRPRPDPPAGRPDRPALPGLQPRGAGLPRAGQRPAPSVLGEHYWNPWECAAASE